MRLPGLLSCMNDHGTVSRCAAVAHVCPDVLLQLCGPQCLSSPKALAAMQQLGNTGDCCRLGERVGVPVYDLGQDASPVEVAKKGVAKAVDDSFDAVIVDTAGRLQVGHAQGRAVAKWQDTAAPAAPAEATMHSLRCAGGSARHLLGSSTDGCVDTCHIGIKSDLVPACRLMRSSWASFETSRTQCSPQTRCW